MYPPIMTIWLVYVITQIWSLRSESNICTWNQENEGNESTNSLASPYTMLFEGSVWAHIWPKTQKPYISKFSYPFPWTPTAQYPSKSSTVPSACWIYHFLYNTNFILIKISKKHETRCTVWLYHERKKCLIFKHVNWIIFIYQLFKNSFDRFFMSFRNSFFTSYYCLILFVFSYLQQSNNRLDDEWLM